jgi:hypothetical protein
MGINAELECRKFFMDFYTSQLNTHGRLIIGFSVLIFTITQMRIDLLGTLAFWNPNATIAILYLGIFSAIWIFFYLIFRDLTYGVLCNLVTSLEWKPEFELGKVMVADFTNYLIREGRKKSESGLSRTLLKFFVNSKDPPFRMKVGYSICTILSLLTTLALFLAIG